MPTETATAQAATPFRSRVLALSLGFLIIMLAVQPAFSATIQTDLWVYQMGDTVTVTGAEYGPGETVEIVTTDPNGVEVDRGVASADEQGAFTYQFVLMSDVPGIYDVIGSGLTSGLVAATQFDPPNFTHSVNAPSPATVQYSDNVTFSGTLNCVNGGGSNPNCPTSAITATATVALRSGGGGFTDVAAVTTTFTLASSSAGCPTQCTAPWSVVWQAGRNLAAGSVSPGTYDVRITISGSTNFGAQQTLSNALTINKEATTTTYDGATTGTSGASVSLSATVADADGGAGAGNGRFLPDANLAGTSVVQFQLFNAANTTAVSGIVSANINSDGATTGSPSLTLPATAGTYQLRTSYLGTTQYTGSADLDAITVNAADGAAPVVTLSLPTPPPGQAGYFNGSQVPVIGSVSAADPSGVTDIDCTDSAGGLTLGPLASNSRTVSINWNGTHNIFCTATDGAGNSGAAIGSSNTATVNIDVDAPTVTATPSRGSDSNDWYNSPFTVSFTGVDVGPSDDVSCAADVTYSGPDTSAGSITQSCSDAAGNSASATFNFQYDSTGPAATATPDRGTDHNGWYNQPVTITFASEGVDLSNSVLCDSPATYSGPDGEDISVSGVCTDAAGNSTTAIFTFDFDDTDPTVTVTPNRAPDHNGWYNSAVTFDTNGTDDTSDIDTCDADLNYTGPDGTDLTVSGSCTDNAGNTGTGTSATFDFDDTDPTVTVTPNRAPDHNGWYNSAVTFDTNGTDDTSDIDTCDADLNYTGPDGTDLTVSGSCTDNAGNTGTGTSAAFDFDDTDPTITLLSRLPAANVHGWNNSAVTATWTCTDGTSGPIDAIVSTTKSGEGFGQFASNHCEDDAGNSSVTATVNNIHIDLSDPSVDISSPADGSNTIAMTIPVSGTSTDGLSGIAIVSANSVPMTVGSGTFSGSVPLDCGSNAIIATAVDKAGNDNADTVQVTRICFSNLQYYQPLDQSSASASQPVTNSGKMGRVIPTKVSFKLDDGTVVTDAVAAAHGWTIEIGVNGPIPATGGPTDLVEAFADAGQSSAGSNTFRWTNGQWVYNLDTGKSPQVQMEINKSYRLDVYVHEGATKLKISTAVYALFKPTK